MKDAADESGLEVRVVTTSGAFAELRPSWRGLVSECETPSVFSSHEWLDAAWQWRQGDSTLYVMACFEGSNLVAALPLMLCMARTRGVAYREAAFLAVPDTQLCDVIVAKHRADRACRAFARELVRRQAAWDVLRLRYLRSDAIAARELREALGEAGLAARTVAAPGNPYIDLDTTWSVYYGSRSRRLKKSSNLVDNRLRRAGEIRIERFPSQGDDIAKQAEWVERVIAISARSWKSETGNSLDNPGPQAFIRRLSEAAAREGILSLWLLWLDDRPIAMEYQLLACGDVFALRSDFDARHNELSPGAYLNRHMLEALFGAGLRRYYMGPGSNEYKFRWTETVEPHAEVSCYGRTLKGRALHGWESALKPVLQRVRARLSRESEPALKDA